MREFEGSVRTNIVGLECEFFFEVEDNATKEEIEEAAKEAVFNWIEWDYEEIRRTKDEKNVWEDKFL